MSHRIYLHSIAGQRHDNSDYDISFQNIRVPVNSPEDDLDDDWFVRVEAFQLEALRLAPLLVFADLVNLDGHSTLGHNVPLLMAPNNSFSAAINRGDVGQRLPCAPARHFQSGSLRLRVTDIEGDLLQRTEGQTVPDQWAVVLVLYRRG